MFNKNDIASLAYDIYKKTNNNDEKYNWFLAEKILYLKFIDEIELSFSFL